MFTAVWLAAALCWAQTGEENPQPKAESKPPVETSQEPERKQEKRKEGDPKRGMSREEAQRWWESLSEEEREKARERMRRYREMSPEARKEMKRRAELLRTVGKEVLDKLNEEERAAFQKLPSPEREKQHQAWVRAELERRGEDMDTWEDMGPPGGLEDRLKRSGKMREEHRERRRERELKAAVEEGWLSEKAAEQLRKLPPEKVDQTLEQVRQLRMIDWLDRNEGWKRMKIDDEERLRLIALEPREFLDEMRKRSGAMRRGGRGGEGPPPGNGPPPRRGEGPGPGPGPGPGGGPGPDREGGGRSFRR